MTSVDPQRLRVINGGQERKSKARSGQSQATSFRYAASGALEALFDGVWQEVCSAISVLALTRDTSGRNWGRYIEISDADDRKHQIAIPAALLVGSRGDAVFEILAGHGCRIEPSQSARKALLRYLNAINNFDGKPLPRAIAATRTGWHGNVFVLPNRSIGGADVVVYQAPSAMNAAVRDSGTLAEWQESVAAPAAGNSRLVLALAAAFAPVLMEPMRYSEGFGLHFRGGSSSGKTTTLMVGASVWGGGGRSGYVQTWLATANGIEATASAHNHLPLFLDELGQGRPEDVGRVAYQLAAGRGKGRAYASGMGVPCQEWQLCFISSGEISLEDKLREARTPLRMMAGQAVRFIDLPADAGKGFGLFDTAPKPCGKPDATKKERGAAFSNDLTASAHKFYGSAGPAFVEAFIADRESSIEQATALMASLACKLVPADADGQVQRVARHISLIAASGELAIAYGVLPWPPGEAVNSARVCFADWLKNRGTVGATEIADAVAHLRAVIERDGVSRFQRPGSNEPVRDRMGVVREDDGDTLYLIFPQAWRNVMAGRDADRAARDLAECGIVIRGSDGRPTRKERIAGQKYPQRVVVVSHAALFNDGEDDGDG